MARVGSTFLNLGMWLRGEKPGAGSQYADNNALNGNVQKIDKALGTQHNTDGTHKSNVITGTNLASSVADGASLLYDGVNHYIKVNALGILTAMINDLAVTGGKIAAATISAGKFVAGAIATADIADGAITAAKIPDGGVTGVKIAAQNNARKITFPFSRTLSSVASDIYFKIGEVIMSQTIGYRMGRAGRLTGISCVNGTLSNSSTLGGSDTFASGDLISMKFGTALPQSVSLMKNGVFWQSLNMGASFQAADTIGYIEVEFDG